MIEQVHFVTLKLQNLDINPIKLIVFFLTAVMLGACVAEPIRATQQDLTMITLGIDLQEGFDGDQVVIDVNGKEFFRQEKVFTKLLLGYAETMVFKVPQGITTIKISLPQKQLEKTIKLDLEKDAYLGISVTSTGLEYIVSDNPFFYQ